NGTAPRGLERRAVFVGDVEAAWELHRVGAAFGRALHAGVTADRHDPASRTADHAAREREVDHHLHIVDPESVLGQAHRVHDVGRAGARIPLSELAHFGFARAGLGT